MEEDNVGLKDLIKKLVEQNELLIETKQAKPWKIPRKGRVNNARVRRGFATIQLLKNNGEVDFLRAAVEPDGTVDVEGFPRVSTADYRMSYKGKPYYIIPEWSIKPFSPAESLDQTEREKMNIAGRRLVLARLQREQIKPTKKGLGGALPWIIFGAIAIGVIWYLMKGGNIF